MAVLRDLFCLTVHLSDCVNVSTSDDPLCAFNMWYKPALSCGEVGIAALASLLLTAGMVVYLWHG